MYILLLIIVVCFVLSIIDIKKQSKEDVLSFNPFFASNFFYCIMFFIGLLVVGISVIAFVLKYLP
jgi:Na+/citrate or Na+/malate symporter